MWGGDDENATTSTFLQRKRAPRLSLVSIFFTRCIYLFFLSEVDGGDGCSRRLSGGWSRRGDMSSMRRGGWRRSLLERLALLREALTADGLAQLHLALEPHSGLRRAADTALGAQVGRLQN